jgi:hypothetical protein
MGCDALIAGLKIAFAIIQVLRDIQQEQSGLKKRLDALLRLFRHQFFDCQPEGPQRKNQRRGKQKKTQYL